MILVQNDLVWNRIWSFQSWRQKIPWMGVNRSIRELLIKIWPGLLTIVSEHKPYEFLPFCISEIFRRACEKGDLNVVKCLTSDIKKFEPEYVWSREEKKPVVNFIDKFKSSDFQYGFSQAARCGNLEMFKLLRSIVLKMEREKSLCSTYFTSAFSNGQLLIIQSFESDWKNQDCAYLFASACKNGHLHVVKAYYQKFLDSNDLTMDWSVQNLCENGHWEGLEFLISRGLNVLNSIHKKFSMCLTHNQWIAFEFLVSYISKLNFTSDWWFGQFTQICQKIKRTNRVRVFRIFEKHGICFTLIQLQPLLLQAIQNQQIDLVSLLICLRVPFPNNLQPEIQKLLNCLVPI